MKKLLYVRHAKSSWDDPGLKDFDRPLAQRGLQDAPRVGRYLKANGVLPEVIISSPARRAEQTAVIIARNIGLSADAIVWDETLYFITVEAYLQAAAKTDDSVSFSMIVGHNPMIEGIVSMLLQKSEKQFLKMPTCAMACLGFNGKRWSEIKFGSCELLWHMVPKKLPPES